MRRRPTPTELRERFRDLLAADEILVAPGAYDAIVALAIERAGFPAAYVTGAGTVNGQLGLPDVGLITLTELAENVNRIAAAVTIPVFSDADTGFGNALGVNRTVHAFEAAGAVGIHIEDQEEFKRCGHLDGKAIVPATEMATKIRAAADARSDSSFVIIARTDAAAVEGVDAAIQRAHQYVAAGADAIFAEALVTPEEFTRFVREGPDVPHIANMTEFGKTPLITASEFQRMGFAAVIFPMTAFRLMLRAVTRGLETLAREGTQTHLLESMHTRAELYEILNYDPADPLREVCGTGDRVRR